MANRVQSGTPGLQLNVVVVVVVVVEVVGETQLGFPQITGHNTS